MLFYIGPAYATGVKSAIINGSQTFIAIILACLVFRYEKLTLKKFIGCIIGFSGVIVINFDPSGLLMLYMALISSVAYSVWGILLKLNPVEKVAVYSFTNPIFSVLLSFVFLGESSSFGIELPISLLLVCGGIFMINQVNE